MNDITPAAEPGRRPANPGPVRLLHLTDFHILPDGGQKMLGVDTERSLSSVLTAALNSGPQPDLALLTGDLVQTPSAAAYGRLKARLQCLPCPCHCLPGNHDDPGLMAKILAGPSVHCEPGILLEHWQIICLNSVVPGEPYGRLPEEQLSLLAALLDAHPDHHALIALHHHPFPCGSQWMDSMVLENSSELFSVLAPHNQVQSVIFGHIHQVMDIRHEGLRLISTPSTCFQFKPNQADFALDALGPGYRWIELYPDGSMATEVKRLGGSPAGLDMESPGY